MITNNVRKRAKVVTILYLFLGSYSFAQQCPDQGLFVQPLGTGGPELSDNLASTGYALWRNGKIVSLIDAGTGSSHNFEKTKQSFNDVDFMLLSHFHTDHSSDFVDYVKNSLFDQRQNNLVVLGPTGNKYAPSMSGFIERLIGKQGVFPYLARYWDGEGSFKIEAIDVAPSSKPNTIKIKDYTLQSVDAEHGVFASLAWKIKVDEKQIVFSGDNSGQSNDLINLAENADLLVIHNAIPSGMHGFIKELHMEPERIGEIAKKAKVKKLLVSHFMNRTLITQKDVKKKIRSNYKNPIFAKELACYAI